MHRKQAWAKRVKKERFKKKYLSRMQATRLLQVDSINFRRLCILKGVYPRAIGRSKQKASGNEKQYYLAKEIKWLVHDQVLQKGMAFRAWEKKVRKATAMQKVDDLKVLDAHKPKYNLVASIKERYPFFIDAVKDIDDALSVVSLYAFLSPEIRSDSTIELHHSLPSGLHEKAKAVLADWNEFVSKAQVLAKGFISIKGYYYEALVKGERVRWLCPHEYAHKFPSGIQQYILITFLEFYLEMMRFVTFKLKADYERDLADVEKAEEEGLNANAEDFGANNAVTQQQLPHQGKLESQLVELSRVRKLFDGFVFFISREVVAKHAILVIRSCGGRVSSLYNSNVTHCVIDRPQLAPGFQKLPNVEYIQPQYLFDCLNARTVLPVVGYRMGEELPPHVSPFTVAITPFKEDIEAVEEAKKAHPKIVSYVPQRVHEIRKFIDPSYSAVDPTGKVAELDGDYSSDDEHAVVPEMDADDDVSLSGDELEEAKKKPEWRDETVTEHPERSKLSAFKVKKQRELNLMNQPTRDNVAMRRQELAKSKEAKKKAETRDERIKRKLAESEKQERATKKMQLQVARKKAARYYKMVSGVVEGNKKKENILAAKAKQLAEGKVQTDAEGKTLLKSKDVERRAKAEAKGKVITKKKGSNPYSKLPKWVR